MGKTLTHYITHIKSLYIIGLILTLISCNTNKIKNEVIIEHENYAELNKEYFVKIFFNNKCKIRRAYFDCLSSNRKLDSSYRIEGCTKQLSVEDDTIKVSFIPTIIGDKKFEDITIVYQDLDKKVYLLDTTFYYKVK